MLNIFIAENSGFCFGVKRAINIIDNVKNDHRDEKVYTLGPIIHNPQTVKRLTEEGIEVLEDIDSINSGVVILRTHGVERSILEKLEKKDITIIDATCPFVGRAQEYVRELNERNYPVIIIGEKDHPEVMALKSQTDKEVYVVSQKDDYTVLKNLHSNRIGIVSQTTQNSDNFKSITSDLMDYFKELHIYNTICNATQLRQNSAIALAKSVDMMIIVGGFNSANTKRLYDLCRNILDRTYHIETEEGIKREWLKKDIHNVGIAAGASTPDWIIDNVKDYLKKYKEEQNDD